MDPALGRFDAAHLDAGQGIVKLLGDGTHFFHAAGQADLVSMVYDLSDGGDHCGSPAEAGLGKFFHFLKEMCIRDST